MDLTHGGDILAEEYLKRGHRVVCADVYRLGTRDMIERVQGIGAEYFDHVPERDYDLKVAPAHCPDHFAKGSTWRSEKTFHRAVGEFIDDDRFRIEVTGVKGKTSTCYVLAHILDATGKRVLLHTSRGTGPYKDGQHDIERTMSIAPTSMLRLPKGDYDAIVSECSLGGTGKADIACITNLLEDYGIAQDTKRASDSKASILTAGKNVVLGSEMGLWGRYGDYVLIPYGGRIAKASKTAIGEPLKVSVSYDRVNGICLDPTYLSLQYLEAMELALTVCKLMGIDEGSALNGLSTFKGVPGRGEVLNVDGRTIIRERNPGISSMSVRRTMECLKEYGMLNDAIAILNPINRKVCDKMDADGIAKVISSYGVEMVLHQGDFKDIDIPEGKRTVIEFIKEGFQ